VPETVYQLETLAERRSSYGSIVMQISLTNVGIKVEFFKKGLQGVPVGKRIRSCFFIFNKDLEKLTDEFRSNFDMPMDVYSAFAKSNMNISDTIVLKKDSLSIRVTCVTDILIDNWENKDGKQLFEIISKRPKFPISKPNALTNYLTNSLEFEANNTGLKASFEVFSDGSVTNQKVNYSTSELLSNNMQKILAEMPQWTQGANNGIGYKIICNVLCVDSATYYANLVRPSFKDGDLEEWLLKNVKSEENRKRGIVVCNFYVEKDGSITHIINPFLLANSLFDAVQRKPKNMRNQGNEAPLAEEARRLLESMPKWNPATLFGDPIGRGGLFIFNFPFKRNRNFIQLFLE